MCAVPDVVQAKLLIPLLTAQAKALVNQMSVDNMSQYEELKKFLLAEYKLTPREYKIRFETATKNADETYTLFAAKLRNLLTYYLESRLVADHKTLIELLISDRLKGSLPQGLLNYVLTQEGEGWYTAEKVASLADVYTNNRATGAGQKAPEGKTARVTTMGTSAGTTAGQSSRGARGGHFQPGRGGGHGGPQSPIKSQRLKCYACGGFGHFAKDCPTPQGSKRDGPRGGFRGGHRGGYRGNPQGSGVRVNLVSTVGQPQVETREMGIQYEDGGSINLITTKNLEFGDHPMVDAVSTVKPNPSVCIYPLQYLNVTVSGCDCVALEDSGCQIPLVSKRLFSWCCNETVGTVTLHGFGRNHTVQAPLVNLTVCICDEERDKVCEIPIVCAITDLYASDYDVILPADVVRKLQAMSMIVDVSSCDVSVVCDVGTETNDPEIENSTPENVDTLPTSGVEADSTALVMEQEQDPTLAMCWSQAQAGKGGFVVHNGLLYHRDQVEGQAVCQLCVPQGRRANILQLAHESVFGGHLGERKTRERIRLSFYWPGLRKSVLSHVQSCCNCQLRSRPMTSDRVPITPITRADVPFQVMNMDCIGPLDPPSAQGHKYCLCIVDSCTRWPSVYMLKSLTAKAVCDALIDLFTHVGVPKVMVSDCGTNFTSQLTQEMLRKLGCSPRFNTPGHPEASGMVERFNQTCKNMLSHVVQEHGRQWHKYVPLIVWALREVPNATTGMSPYMLVYGRVPRGPLAVLKETWAGEQELPPDLGKPIAEYLQDLRDKLGAAAQYATENADKQQAGYVGRYNLRAHYKKFHEGDQVIVLAPESGGKLLNKWQGPGTVVKVISQNSYLVDLGANGTRHLHANKMRHFVARVNGCSVINDGDVDFGCVLTPTPLVVSSLLPSGRVAEDKLDHLTPDQRQDLLELLDEFAGQFSDHPGRCDTAVHRIQTTADFVPRQMRPYRVPDAVKPEVDRQIQDLLDKGLIRRSDSPMASPIVCVAKKDGGVRIACDYRYLNSFTVGDAYPMPTIDEVLRNIGKGNFISTFDARSGYWQIPLAKEDRWLSAFVTHEGLYEWLRMPFGLKNAGATFVRAVRLMLHPIRSFADSYVDDMGVGSQDWGSHLGHVRQFLEIIRGAGMTMNLAKCEFGKPEVKFVGRLVGSEPTDPIPNVWKAWPRWSPHAPKRSYVHYWEPLATTGSISHIIRILPGPSLI